MVNTIDLKEVERFVRDKLGEHYLGHTFTERHYPYVRRETAPMHFMSLMLSPRIILL